MANEGTKSTLTVQQAAMLLAPLGDISIENVAVAATTNDVFKVTTAKHGTYFIKFHTARWYADQPDTFFVVGRECAVPELLRKRGMPLPYRAWGDVTCSVVPRSVFICEELGGTPLPVALDEFPDEASDVLHSFGRYMEALHSIEFSRPGLLAHAHAYFAPPTGTIPPVFAWDAGHLHSPEALQRDATEMLNEKAPRLPASVTPRLAEMFSSLADTVEEDYDPPRFTVGNCHAWHFHVDKADGRWEVLGFYDHEACSAGDATIDLVELEITLTPSTGGNAWRQAFIDGYGSTPSFDAYRRRLLYYLLCEVGGSPTRMIPDPTWLDGQWDCLIDAEDWEEFVWYPGSR